MAGRPVGSDIRQNIIEILAIVGRAYGYQLATMYLEVFPPTTKRNIYYHLRKGVSLNEFKIEEVVEETGEYSWGDKAEKVYYSLGPHAKVYGDERVETLRKDLQET